MTACPWAGRPINATEALADPGNTLASLGDRACTKNVPALAAKTTATTHAPARLTQFLPSRICFRPIRFPVLVRIHSSRNAFKTRVFPKIGMLKKGGLTLKYQGGSVPEPLRKSKYLLIFWAAGAARPTKKVGACFFPKSQRVVLASATVSAVMFTMRRTVALAVRMCTGFATPSSTGPIAMLPPAAVLSRL